MPFIHTNTHTYIHIHKNTHIHTVVVDQPTCKYYFIVFENKEKMVLVMEIAAGGELYDYLRNSEEKTTPMNPKSIIY